MDPIRWQRLETLFHDALERTGPDRLAVLERETQDDPSLYAEVQAMLLAHDVERPFAFEAVLAPEDGDRSEPAPGTRIGPYRLVELAGRGGMGLVYRAERADGHYTQTVALKLLRSGLTTSDLLARFRVERQILARLEHPGIARLLDGGITDDGMPWLVMEHVRGRPITTHCDAQRLTIERRLQLFLDVCSAVQHAHSNLVVHRDLKPSNILVTPDDAVKLLDFGIARLITADVQVLPVTRTLLPVMTPEYASPEQVRGDAVTTATDVYALGLLLYELLCGERAHEGGSSLMALQRSICEDVPRVPSERLQSVPAEDATRRAAERGVTPERLRRRLKGDLDTIAATALRKDPARRYSSVESLARDVQRHLTGLPVVARPDTFSYRTVKFVKRHAVWIGAAAIVLVSIALGLALALQGMVRAREAERTALAEATTANSVSSFLADLFKASDPAEARGDTVTARELLDRGAIRVREQLADEPVVRARLLRTIAQAYSSLGLFAAAMPLLEDAVAILAAHGTSGANEHAAALGQLSMLYGSAGEYARARALAEQAVATHDRAGDTASVELVAALNTLGTANGRLGQLAEARTALDRAVIIAERIHGPEHINTYSPLNNLAIVHWLEGDAGGATVLYERALIILEREYGQDHPTLAHTLNNLALAHLQAGDPGEAIAAHQRALAIREKILAPDHPDIAESLNNLGVALLDVDEFVRARDLFQRALPIREQGLGPDHPNTISTVSNLAAASYGLGDAAAAESLYVRARDGFERSLGPDHLSLAHPILGLARLARDRGDASAADATYRRVLEIRAQLGNEHPDVTAVVREYAEYLDAQGRTVEADALRRRTRPPAEPPSGG